MATLTDAEATALTEDGARELDDGTIMATLEALDPLNEREWDGGDLHRLWSEAGRRGLLEKG